MPGVMSPGHSGAWLQPGWRHEGYKRTAAGSVCSRGMQSGARAAQSRKGKHREIIGAATLYLGDSMEVPPTLPKVDAVITDPPLWDRHCREPVGRCMKGLIGTQRRQMNPF